ncbi:MAG: response regulator transcription factor [Paludibacter sp.]
MIVSKKKPDIIIVDDHQIFRDGLKYLIKFENLGNVLAEAADGKEFIKLLGQMKPDLVFMDIDLPDMSGIEATKIALSMMPDMKIIAITMFAEEEYLYRMIDAGAVGFIQKSTDLKELDGAIKLVMRGEKFFSINLADKRNEQLW